MNKPSNKTIEMLKDKLSNDENKEVFSSVEAAIAIQQSRTAKMQFKITNRLTYFIIVISLISIIPTLKELFYTNQNTILFEHILKQESEKLQNTETTLILSNHLDSLQNQVRTLEKQNEVISKKKID